MGRFGHPCRQPKFTQSHDFLKLLRVFVDVTATALPLQLKSVSPGPSLELHSPYTEHSSHSPDAGLRPEVHGGHPRAATPRHRQRVAAIGLAMVLLLLAAAVGGWVENSRWQPRYTAATKRATLLARSVSHWRSSSIRWQTSSATYHSQLTGLKTKVASTVGNLDKPHFVLWNSCGAAGPKAGCPLAPGQEYVGGLPDTFTYRVRFHSTMPVTVRIMSAHDYVCWETGNCDSHWWWWQNRRSLNDVFHAAEGCADYLAVFTTTETGTLYPNISVTRNPAPRPTGGCR